MLFEEVFNNSEKYIKVGPFRKDQGVVTLYQNPSIAILKRIINDPKHYNELRGLILDNGNCLFWKSTEVLHHQIERELQLAPRRPRLYMNKVHDELVLSYDAKDEDIIKNNEYLKNLDEVKIADVK